METGEGEQLRSVRNEVPQNKVPELLLTGFGTIKLLVETYGWLILIALSVGIYLYQKYKPSYEKWRQKQELLKEEEKNKKNPELAYNVQLKMEEARRKLQDKVLADYAVKKEKELLLAEQKRLQKIEEWEKHKEGRGYHSKSRKPPEESTDVNAAKPLKPRKKNEFRPEFNPLGGGGGGSSGYRPSRRNMNSGG